MATKKNLRTFSVILIVAILLAMSACTDNETQINIEECYQIRTNSDLTYSYEITNLKGKVIYSESSVIKPPTVRLLSNSVLEVSAQAGTGLSTNRSVFCDIKTSNVSDTFYYVLGAKDDYVFYIKYIDQVHTIVCQNIFDSEELTQEYRVEDDLIVLNSFSKADFGTEGVAIISYLTGDTAIQQEYIHIYFGD